MLTIQAPALENWQIHLVKFLEQDPSRTNGAVFIGMVCWAGSE